MRLSGFVVSSLFFLSMSVAVLCQHPAGGGSHPSGGSAGGYSGVPSSGVSSHVGGASSVGSSGGSRSSNYVHPPSERDKTGSNKVGSSAGIRTSDANSEKRGFFDPIHCKKGQHCFVCQKTGTCIVKTSCANGLVWNGSSCGPAKHLRNDCRQIANELAAMRRQMLEQNDLSMNLRYEMLVRKYKNCMGLYGGDPLITDAN
jgi:hypothetical protein